MFSPSDPGCHGQRVIRELAVAEVIRSKKRSVGTNLDPALSTFVKKGPKADPIIPGIKLFSTKT